MQAVTRAGSRLMGLDYGSRTVGVAVTDPLGMIVRPEETICRDREDKLRRTLARILEMTCRLGVAGIVIGLPLHMDGTECGIPRSRRKEMIDQVAACIILKDYIGCLSQRERSSAKTRP